MNADIRNFLSDSLSERIQSMLSLGLEPAVVARTVGISVEQIQQLMENDEFSSAVVSAKIEHAVSASNRDRKLEQLEDTAIERLSRSLEMTPLMKPMEAAKILSIVNQTKRRGAETNGNTPQSGAAIVGILLPEVARVNFTLNQNSQVVDVDGRSMAALPTNKLLELAVQRRQVIEAAPAQRHDAKRAEAVIDKIGATQLQEPPPVRNVLPPV